MGGSILPYLPRVFAHVVKLFVLAISRYEQKGTYVEYYGILWYIVKLTFHYFNNLMIRTSN